MKPALIDSQLSGQGSGSTPSASTVTEMTATWNASFFTAAWWRGGASLTKECSRNARLAAIVPTVRAMSCRDYRDNHDDGND